MIGALPTTLEVNGKAYRIDADFRNVLEIFVAFNDPDLEDKEKAYICLQRLYTDFESMPTEDVQAAYEQAAKFLSCNTQDTGKRENRAQLVNWVKDEPLIFPAINKAAGMEIRTLPFVHWWTFMGWFQSIDRDAVWGTVLTIRQKKSKGKKLESYEKEFEKENRELCSVTVHAKAPTPENALAAMFAELTKGGD